MTMSRWKQAVLLGLTITPLAWAAPKLGVDVSKSSDRVEIRFSQPVPFATLTQKWQEKPHRLEITVPKVEWAGKGGTRIDKGVIQKVDIKPAQGGVTVTVMALQSPKMSWVSSADQKTWTLRMATNELSYSNEPARLPNEAAAAVPAKPVQTVEKPPSKPVATPPSKPVTIHNPTPVPVTPPVTPPATQKGPAEGPEQKPITINLKNKDLPTAIREMARAAGMEADVGPGVEGTVTASFTDTPLARCLTSVLGKQAKLYEFKVVNNRLRVFGDGETGGTTLVTSAPPTTPTTAASGQQVSDYFPIVPEKPVSDLAAAVRKAVAGVDVIQDDRLNVLFVSGDAAEVEKVRNLLQNVLAK